MIIVAVLRVNILLAILILMIIVAVLRVNILLTILISMIIVVLDAGMVYVMVYVALAEGIDKISINNGDYITKNREGNMIKLE